MRGILMNTSRSAKILIVLTALSQLPLATLGLAAPPPQTPGQLPRDSAIPVHDIRLNPTGEIAGMVVDSTNHTLANAAVTVWQETRLISSTTTDSEGQFKIEIRRGGVYRIQAGGSVLV